MPNLEPEYQAQIERNERLHRLANLDARRALYRTSLYIVCWTLCGLALIGSAFHTNDPELGAIYFLAGKIVWIGGLSVSLLAHYARSAKRGD